MSRNPIYFGTFLLTIAVGAWAQSVAFLFAVVLVALAYVVLTTAMKEQALLRCYGDAFQAYRHRVPRFALTFGSSTREARLKCRRRVCGTNSADVQVGVDSHPLQSRDSPAI